MDSTLLRPDQRTRLVIELERQLRYLNNLASRMQMLRFPEEDPLSKDVLHACHVIQHLVVVARASGPYERAVPPGRG